MSGHIPWAEVKREARRIGLLEGAVDQLLHVIDCDQPLFGDSRCPRCASLHDGHHGELKPHEQRWCDGNTYDVALRELRAARRAATPDLVDHVLGDVDR